jgi:2-isopropylmalate synthase
MVRDKLLIFDTSLRDGEQAPGCSMNINEKLLVARKLQLLGVDIIEAGFPVASPSDAEAVRLIASEVEGPIIGAFARCTEKDIRAAWEALSHSPRPRIHTCFSTSDIHLTFDLKISREDALRKAASMVAYARSLCSDIEFSAQDATRSDRGYLCEVLQAVVDAGAATLNICDTVGYSTPPEYAGLIRTIRNRLRNAEHVVLSTHCHDDLGLAVANSLAGVEAGARQAECTVNGIGERAGNASLEEIAMVSRPPRSLFGRNWHTPRGDLLDQLLASEDPGIRTPTEQGNRGTECICARSRYASARHPQQSAVLRNHDAGIGWGAS